MTAAVTGVLRALIEAANPKPLEIIADNAKLNAKLTNNSTTQRQVLKNLIEEIVILAETLENDYQFTPAKLQALQRDPSLVPWTPPAANTLPKATPERPDHKLGRFFQFDIHNGLTIVQDFRTQNSWSYPTNLAEARQQCLELIALQGCYIRVTASIVAAGQAAVTLAEALALFRTEGDLVAPLPQWNLQQKYPPIETALDFEFSSPPPVDVKLAIKPTMKHGLWSLPKATFLVLLPKAAGASPELWEEAVKLLAFLHWHLVVAGLDFMFTKVWTGGDILEEYYAFGMALRTANGMSIGSTRLEREASYDKQLDQLKFTEKNGLLVVAPTDPVLLLSGILATALLLMKAPGKPGMDGPFILPVPALRYLAYNTQDTRHLTDPTKDKFSWVLASAAVALAKKPVPPDYCKAAHAMVRALGFLTEKLPGVADGAKEASAKHGDVATKIKTNFNETEMKELAQFILRAEPADWGSFRKHRSNAARYARLLAYYEVVAAP